MKRLFLKIYLGVFIGLVIFVFSFYIWEYLEGTHRLDFQIDDKYSIEITSDECETCFKDWEIDHELKITNLLTKESFDYAFSTGEGPFLKFYTSITHPDLMLIEGYEGNTGASWLVDIKGKNVSQTRDLGTYNFLLRNSISQDFQVILELPEFKPAF
ncbi:MAG: hypothetical protein QNL60_07770 [Flavobacteriales bacterium]